MAKFEWRKPARRLGWAALAVALAIAIGTLLPRPLRGTGDDPKGAGRHILVLSNPIHTDIAVPLDDDLRRRFAFLANAGLPLDHPDARWLIFGWGGRAFYLETPTWSDLKPLPLLKALTVDRAVMHVEIAGEIMEPQPGVTGLEISDAGYGHLLAFIRAGFSDGPGGAVLIADESYGLNDRFYEATGLFNALVGCNTWTGRALREAGLRTGWWNPLPQLLRVSLALYN